MWENDPRAQLIDPIKITLNTFAMKYEIRMREKVTAEMHLNTSHVTGLPEGTILNVKEIINDRARVSYHAYGWVNVKRNLINLLSENRDLVVFKSRMDIKGKIIDYNEMENCIKLDIIIKVKIG